jgi:hypothetical protein
LTEYLKEPGDKRGGRQSEFIEEIKARLGIKAFGRKIREQGGALPALRELFWAFAPGQRGDPEEASTSIDREGSSKNGSD